MSITYFVDKNLYINITNRCSNNCDFCVRRKQNTYGDSGVLWLSREPEVSEVLKAVHSADWKSAPEIIFCGFGEPTMRLDAMLEVVRALKDENPCAVLRLNTNGHGSLIAGRDIAPELKGLFNTVSVSLNYPDEASYVEHCRPMSPSKAYNAVLDFIQSAAAHVPRVVVSVTSLLSHNDIELARKFAKNLGAEFRLRQIM